MSIKTEDRAFDLGTVKGYDEGRAELRAEVLAYLEANEHPDEWGVTCVYTKRLRVLLDEPTYVEAAKHERLGSGNE
jgi:hypothetical protein